MDALTLDQLLVFTVTVDQGSFSAASRVLHRTQSAITYTIQKFEDQIGSPLFDRSAYRPVLTPTGSALLPRARRILNETNLLRGQAKAMALGLEAEVRLGISEMVPVRFLMPALSAFRAEYPTVSLRIITGAFGLEEGLINGGLDVAVLLDVELPDGLTCNRLSTISLVAVAAMNHPLGKLQGVITNDRLREELQIVLTDRRDVAGGLDHGVAALDSWRVTDLETKRGLLCAGLGWGSMPEPIVSGDIAEGRLMKLKVERWDGKDHMPHLDVVAAQCAARPPGPAGAALCAALIRHSSVSAFGADTES